MNRSAIVCVDDELIVRTSLREQLQRHFGGEHVVETAEDGQSALELIDELTQDGVDISVFISDQIMPGIQGDELLIQVHGILPRTLKILLTAQASADAVGNALNRARLFRYIAKPWEQADLMLSVREAIRSYFQDKQLEEQNHALAQRTEELSIANGALGAANQRLQSELAQRELMERERAALQAQMIEAQRARLAEMSTPLIPITDRIMVMPLIGAVDAERAAQVMEVALEGAQRYQTQVVILDVTGVKHIDTQVVGSLLKIASALRLLGAQAVLTGIRAEVAQAIVVLGADLSGVVTKGTLQRGIAYAIERCGEL